MKKIDFAKALVAAVQLRQVARVSSLLRFGANPNIRDKQEWTPLFWACQEGLSSVVKKLIEAGASVNLQDSEGFTPLMLATGEGYPQIVRSLINAGAKVNHRCRGHENGTALHLAAT